MNKTKVIATIGSITSTIEMIRSLIINGVDVVRLNMSYCNSDFCRDIIGKVEQVNKELGTHVAIMIDIKGPLIRVGRFMDGHAFFKLHDKIRIFMNPVLGDCTKFSIDYPKLSQEVERGTILKIDGGVVELQVIDKEDDYILCEVKKEGIIADNKSMNIPTIRMHRPYLDEEDKRIIRFAHEVNADFLSLPFIRSSEDILDVNDLLIDLGNDHMALLARVENQFAIDDIDNIIKVSDGIIVSREDLGVEVPIERIPGIQKKIIQKAHIAGIISIVATELLATMASYNYPTKSEVSDIASAVLDGTDAVMLCGETTTGQYPIETLKMLEKIIRSAEQDINYGYLMEMAAKTEKRDTTGTLAYSVAGCASRLQCKAIFAPTMTGYTAKKMSRFRPICPIIAISPSESTIKSLTLNFGIYPILIDDLNNLDVMIEKSKKIASEVLNFQTGDTIIITGGYPFKKVKHTNFMKIEEI